MTFANGNRAIALCDRCGQQYKYLQLRQEWNGLFTCPDCFEPKHPQLDPGHHPADAIALQDPRPARQEPVKVFVGDPGDSAFMTTVQGTSPDDGSAPTTSSSMLPQIPHQKLTIVSVVGTVTVVIS
tara:strand:+ start:134 stop:511 length:378 start_codon:yes stop_codon:yes gene_type:complete